MEYLYNELRLRGILCQKEYPIAVYYIRYTCRQGYFARTHGPIDQLSSCYRRRGWASIEFWFGTAEETYCFY